MHGGGGLVYVSEENQHTMSRQSSCPSRSRSRLNHYLREKQALHKEELDSKRRQAAERRRETRSQSQAESDLPSGGPTPAAPPLPVARGFDDYLCQLLQFVVKPLKIVLVNTLPLSKWCGAIILQDDGKVFHDYPNQEKGAAFGYVMNVTKQNDKVIGHMAGVLRTDDQREFTWNLKDIQPGVYNLHEGGVMCVTECMIQQ